MKFFSRIRILFNSEISNETAINIFLRRETKKGLGLFLSKLQRLIVCRNTILYLKYSLLVYFFLNIINCSTIIKIPVVKNSPPGFEQSMGVGRNLGIYVSKSEESIFRDIREWKYLIQGSVLNKFLEKRYFKIVDISKREARLKEVVFSQMMGVNKDITKDLPVDILLSIEIPQEPISECNQYTQFYFRQECAKIDAMGKCLRYVQKKIPEYSKVLTYTVFVKAKMMNLETGQSLEYTNSEPAVLTRKSGSPFIDCPSKVEALNEALNIASEEIAMRLSPSVEEIDVKVYKDDTGFSESLKKKEILKLLESGNSWLKTDKPNIELARRDWETALKLSNQTSASAFWNLGVYYWFKGDLIIAGDYFKKSFQIGQDLGWVDSKKRNTFSIFEAEKERLLLQMEGK